MESIILENLIFIFLHNLSHCGLFRHDYISIEKFQKKLLKENSGDIIIMHIIKTKSHKTARDDSDIDPIERI